ncbi:MAG: hypothetical protein U0R51_04545 [Solirubrobacterales bacterium]
MRFPIPAALPAIAIALIALAGCGGNDSGTGEDPPDDFAITVEHSDGSVPPPAHVQWRLAVDETGQGILDYVPDYPGDGVPTFTAQFDVDPGAVDDLYSALAKRDLLRDLDPDPDPPIGGATESATVTADGKTFEIPAFADGAAPLAPLERQIHRLAPRQVWDDFAKRREAYAAKRYDAAS